jgi:hypothetical protein
LNNSALASQKAELFEKFGVPGRQRQPIGNVIDDAVGLRLFDVPLAREKSASRQKIINKKRSKPPL